MLADIPVIDPPVLNNKRLLELALALDPFVAAWKEGGSPCGDPMGYETWVVTTRLSTAVEKHGWQGAYARFPEVGRILGHLESLLFPKDPLPPYSGVATMCVKCGSNRASETYKDSMRCVGPAHGWEMASGLGLPNPRLCRQCESCGHAWDEATADPEDAHRVALFEQGVEAHREATARAFKQSGGSPIVLPLPPRDKRGRWWRRAEPAT